MITSTFIKSIQDIMRQDDGVDGDAQRLSQLVWMIFLKILDDQDKELSVMDSSYKQTLPDELRWGAWAGHEEGITGDKLLSFVNNELFEKLRTLSSAKTNPRAEIIRSVFEDTHNYMKNGTLLRQVINKINSIDFNASEDRHQFNDLYEKLLKDLQSAGNAGEYYTPRAVTRFIVEMVDPKLGDKILDPACGTGGFLANAIDHVRQQAKTPEDERLLQKSINGVDKKQLPHMLCVTNMMLHGIEVPTQIRRDNTLGRPLRDYGPSDSVDVIVTNPPFGGTEEPGIEQNFPQAFRTRETADLFLVLIMKLLKPGGRAGMVLPDGTLFGEGVKTRIKEELLEKCDLHTIVRLPNNVFAPYTGIRTNLLFITKGGPTKGIWFYEHPYPEGQKSYNKTNPISIEEFEPEKQWWSDRRETDCAWYVDIKEIRKRNFNLDAKNPNAKTEDDLDPRQLLADYRERQAKVQAVLSDIRTILEEAISHHDN